LAEKPYGLLSYGVFFVLVALSLALFAMGLVGLLEVPSIIITLSGIWIIVLAGLQTGKQDKYGRSAFSTFSWGTIIATLGLVWFLYIRQILVAYLPVIFLLVFGIIIIVAALRHQKK
jgi:hypothetical protein